MDVDAENFRCSPLSISAVPVCKAEHSDTVSCMQDSSTKMHGFPVDILHVAVQGKCITHDRSSAENLEEPLSFYMEHGDPDSVIT